MKVVIMVVMVIMVGMLSGCSIGEGSCVVDQAGWQTQYNKKYDRTEFYFWMEGWECSYDE